MNFFHLVSAYVVLQILVLLGFLSVWIFTVIARWSGKPMSARRELKLHYGLIASVFCIALSQPMLPHSDFFRPPAKLWSAHSRSAGPSLISTQIREEKTLVIGTANRDLAVSERSATLTFLLIASLVGIMGAIRLRKDLRLLKKIRKNSHLIRRLGNLRISIHEEIQVPFSFWLPGSMNVVVPSSLLFHSKDFRMAVTHEIQHHRQGDTRWVHFLWVFRGVCALNPFIYFWCRWISETQEFACDEALVDRNKVDSRQYMRLLVRVAKTALHGEGIPACATGFSFPVGRHLLKRRVKKMLNAQSKKMGGVLFAAGACALVLFLGGAAYASKGFFQDRTVSLAQARQWAEAVNVNSEFPVVVNDLVVRELNLFVGTPEGREYIRGALTRLENHRALVEAKLREYGVPMELAAIPIIESGYRNIRSPGGRAAGLWMFIAPTARQFGLRINENVDQRMDIPLETDAAMRLLKSDQLQFQDWSLAVLSYNLGSRRVMEGINQTGERDAWVLVRSGFENDADYLPRLMAAILLMKNPDFFE